MVFTSLHVVAKAYLPQGNQIKQNTIRLLPEHREVVELSIVSANYATPITWHLSRFAYSRYVTTPIDMCPSLNGGTTPTSLILHLVSWQAWQTTLTWTNTVAGLSVIMLPWWTAQLREETLLQCTVINTCLLLTVSYSILFVFLSFMWSERVIVQVFLQTIHMARAS